MKQLTLLLAALLLSAGALAGSCPRLMAEIDERLASGPMLEPELLDEVIALRAEGEDAHRTGRHGEAMSALQEALAILEEVDGE